MQYSHISAINLSVCQTTWSYLDCWVEMGSGPDQFPNCFFQCVLHICFCVIHPWVYIFTFIKAVFLWPRHKMKR